MTNHLIRDGMSVSSYRAVDVSTRGPAHRFRIDTQIGTVYGITVREAIDIANALMHLAGDVLKVEAEHQADAGTNRQATQDAYRTT